MALDRYFNFKNSALLGEIEVFNGFPQPQYLGFSDLAKKIKAPTWYKISMTCKRHSQNINLTLYLFSNLKGLTDAYDLREKRERFL